MTQPSANVYEALLTLKQEYEHLYYLDVAVNDVRYEVVFRPLSFLETESVSEAAESLGRYETNDWVCRMGVLYCNRLVDKRYFAFFLNTKTPAGLADTIAESIVGVSGFESRDKYLRLLDKARKDVNTIQANLETFICTAFPGTKPMDVRKMNIHQQVEMLARAEKVLGQTLDLSPQDSKKKRGQQLSPQAAAILSQEVADRPDPDKDNATMGSFLTGPERMGV